MGNVSGGCALKRRHVMYTSCTKCMHQSFELGLVPSTASVCNRCCFIPLPLPHIFPLYSHT